MIKIDVISQEPDIVYFTKSYYGEFITGDIAKQFLIDVEYWDIKNYTEQWEQGLNLLKTKSKSCLILSISDAPSLRWLLFYKEKNKIFIQDQFLVEELHERYIGTRIVTTQNCYNFIPPRQTQYKGNGINWSIPLEKITKSISVSITNPVPENIQSIPYIKGKIKIDNYKESITIPIDYWSNQEYEKQWQDGINQIFS